ncbi:TniB family NTP-binding protein [Glycomyces sp. MUSA5-2]|uniref:TniB family NTP-binding protein n=1 Tax=Glycomyces sp. MUSA5-2 TaxID=2053002 RepID=UPI00300AAF2D
MTDRAEHTEQSVDLGFDFDFDFGGPPTAAEPRTKEDWRSYIRAAPPPRPQLPPPAEYDLMPAHERRLLNQARARYHSHLIIVNTPAMRRMHAEVYRKMRLNHDQPPGARRGLVIDGLPGIGKSTIVKTFAASFERSLHLEHPERFAEPLRFEYQGQMIRCDYTPVIYISIPTQATPKDLSVAIAEWLHVPLRRTGGTKTQITTLVLRAMQACGTVLVILDDVHFLRLGHKEGQVMNDHLKHLANHTSATFVLVGHGLEKAGLFGEGSATTRATQTSGRFSRYDLGRLSPKGEAGIREWATVIADLERALVLYRHQAGSLAEKHWKYLYDRTTGSIASLSELIRAAAHHAVDTGTEAITLPVLRAITTDFRSTDAFQRRRRSSTEPGTVEP